MISSHLLTTQNLVKGLLNSSLMRDLVEIARETRDPDHPSAQIIKWFMTLKKGVSLPAAPPDNEDLSQSRNELNGDREELVKQFHKFTTELHENGQWDERLRRTSCPHCELTPIGPIITSCMHLYCEECYFILKTVSLLRMGSQYVKHATTLSRRPHIAALPNVSYSMSRRSLPV